MKKKALIIALNENWTGISRLPSGLVRAGFEVSALAPKKSLLGKTKHLKESILYPTFTYSRSKLVYLWIIYAFLKLKPEVVIPGDEDTILALQNVSNLLERLPFFHSVSKLIRSSITGKEFDQLVLSKSSFQKKCNEWGLRTPKNIIVHNLAEALMAAADMSYPVVIKYDSGYGGSGVFICETEVDLKNHFQNLGGPSLVTILKETFKRMFFVSIFSSEKVISIQQYIDGQVGQSPFCANEGVVFGFNPMLRLRTFPGKTGPASVSCGYENEDIEAFVKTIAKKMNYSGFGSVEYIIDSKSKLLHIIELNPRPTPTCHIKDDVVTNDLCECYFNGLNKIPFELKSFRPYTIAMFPGEKRRDPNSEFLKTAFHDVPEGDQVLFKALNDL